MDQSSHLKNDLLKSLIKIAEDRFADPQAQQLATFLENFFRHVPPSDIFDHDPEDLFGAAVTIWTFAKKRQAGHVKLRAYNPRFESHGWQSSHSVIEIINDDMPFLVDSITAALNTMGLTVHLVIHPIMQIDRTTANQPKLLRSASDQPHAITESFMHVQISAQSSDQDLERIEATLRQVLSDVRAAVEDWQAMRQQMKAVIDTIAKARLPKDLPEPIDKQEISAFLAWIEDNNFTFLGYREYDYVGRGGTARIDDAGPGLGLLRDPGLAVFDNMRELGRLPADIRDFVLTPRMLMVMKSNQRSTVHRTVHLDVITVQKFNAKGKVTGEHRFIGLFTSVAYNTRPSDIPLLRHKVARISELAGLSPSSHDHKGLVNVLETYPRDELFQANVNELCDIALGIVYLQERKRTALFVRRDAFERFVSCIVYVSRDGYSTVIRRRFGEILSTAFNGEVAAFYTQMSESTLARLHVIIRTTRGEIPEIDLAAVEARLIDAARSWDDKLHQSLIDSHGEELGNQLMATYGMHFPTAYRERFSVHAAIADIERMESLQGSDGLAMNLYRPIGTEDAYLHFKVYHLGSPVPLSDIMPMIENMGLKVISEHPFAIQRAQDNIYIHEFIMSMADDISCDLVQVRDSFQQAFQAVWRGDMENDRFNSLVLRAGLSWPLVAVLRAYARYLQQARATFSLTYMQETLSRHGAVAARLIDYFQARFACDIDDDVRSSSTAAIRDDIESMLNDVANLDEDRILRRFMNLIDCSLRCNFFQTDNGHRKPYFAVKLDSRRLEELPAPRPMVEVWVCSPRVEGVHLRGGKIARGGIRWSDRREDFRTEVLGLMKAQMVKNAVIVPVGSKGGFVIKQPPANRDALQAEAIACYQFLMRGLLDLTDNIKGDEIIGPTDLVCHDAPDPYLVVAADKGTASFSDIANGVARDYGFWLDDAFASGGSAGYDHKKMAITARGAWESVKRHFREMGHDVQNQDFTVIGCGDMSGDVFGNGMLLSKHIRLLAAFNHLHIFIDPNPDPAKSWTERQRLFKMPRSSWSDYDVKKISKGGGVFDRSAKSLTLSSEIQAALGIQHSKVAPFELIRHILQMPADLMWFGGIGTYIRGADESDIAVGDRGNDAVRIGADAVRAKVIGEGANLGVTQQGRIEFALNGGRINTDAIDNSAGVDCSDHEVNIKILLSDVVTAGDLTGKQRDRLLAEMTDRVADLVLLDNYQQTQALTLAESDGAQALDGQNRLMRQLEHGPLNLHRRLEGLPNDEEIADRRSTATGLTRPELAILLSYAKMALYDDLLATDLPDDAALSDDLIRYFPEKLWQKFPAAIPRHRLRREIIASSVTNSMINSVGALFVNDVQQQTGGSAAEIARAYVIARDVFDVDRLWAAVDALDNKVISSIQTAMLLKIRTMVASGTIWFLRHAPQPLDIAALRTAYRDGIAEIANGLELYLSEDENSALQNSIQGLQQAGVPATLARSIAATDFLAHAGDIVRVAGLQNRDVGSVATVYFDLGQRFSITWLRQQTAGLDADSHWQRMAIDALINELFNHQIKLTEQVLASLPATPAGAKAARKKANVTAVKAVTIWAEDRQAAIARSHQLLAEIRGNETIDLAMLAVAGGQIRSLVD